jgi:hypothetical protein
MDAQYDIYFAGEVIDGHDPTAVRSSLGKLFKADEATLDKLFSGKLLAIKRGCDKATALKYQQAMERAGATAVIRAAGTPEPESHLPRDSAKEQPASAADKIAALATAPDEVGYRSDQSAAAEVDEPAAEGMDIAPAGSDVLRPEERPASEAVEVDTSGLAVDPDAERLSEIPQPPPPAPDTGHLSMGEVGETIPVLDRGPIPAEPSTDHIGLSPSGTDFSDCAAPEPETPNLDLSAMELAPSGSDVLEEQYRKHKVPPPPDTDHLSLED